MTTWYVMRSLSADNTNAKPPEPRSQIPDLERGPANQLVVITALLLMHEEVLAK